MKARTMIVLIGAVLGTSSCYRSSSEIQNSEQPITNDPDAQQFAEEAVKKHITQRRNYLPEIIKMSYERKGNSWIVEVYYAPDTPDNSVIYEVSDDGTVENYTDKMIGRHLRELYERDE